MLKNYIEDIKSRWVKYRYERGGDKYNEFMGFTNGDEIDITMRGIGDYIFDVILYWDVDFVTRTGCFITESLPNKTNKFKMVIVGDDITLKCLFNGPLEAIKLSRHFFHYYVRYRCFIINTDKRSDFTPTKQINRFELHK